jgi:hypothetical protein
MLKGWNTKVLLEFRILMRGLPTKQKRVFYIITMHRQENQLIKDHLVIRGR